MTNPSETRLREIVAEIDGILKDLPQPDGPGAVSSFYTSLSLGEVRALAADTIDRLTSSGEAGGVTAIVDGLREDYETVRKWSGSALVAGELSKSETREGLTQLYSDLCGLLNSLGYYADQLESASPREGHVEVPVEPETIATLRHECARTGPCSMNGDGCTCTAGELANRHNFMVHAATTVVREPTEAEIASALEESAEALRSMYRGDDAEDEPFYAMATKAVSAYLAALPHNQGGTKP